jgi:pyrroloquinoline quinone biosynthesis protein D
MTARLSIELATIARLAPHTRLRFDEARQIWTIQAPERTFILDAPGHAIVSRCDGSIPVSGIIDSLCAAFVDAPRDVIEKDVIALLQDFADKGVVTA